MCGLVGLAYRQGPCAPSIFEALLMLQHRGQDSAGILSYDKGHLHEVRGRGLVNDLFDATALSRLSGSYGLGHVRYPTAGSDSASETQPFYVNAPLGIALVHNGNLTNSEALTQWLATDARRHLRTASDSEVLLNVFAQEIEYHYRSNPTASKREAVFAGARASMRRLRGAYSVVALVDGVGLLGWRDPHGIRPLSLGARSETEGSTSWALASEDIAYGTLGFSHRSDVAPGEMVLIDLDGEVERRQLATARPAPCIFEYIYLARPDSTLNGISVYEVQRRLGSALAKQVRALREQIDVVVPVPDASRPTAIELAATLGLPYREGLIKNRYVGRTFIMPDQRTREASVRRKLNPMASVFDGQRVLLVDDSIVRGTTMRAIVALCRSAGAASVTVASASPPVRHPNVYGVDMPLADEFIANGLDEVAICEELGADGLIYQRLEDLLGVAQSLNPELERFETSVFDGLYITGDIDQAYLERLAQTRGAGRALPHRRTIQSVS